MSRSYEQGGLPSDIESEVSLFTSRVISTARQLMDDASSGIRCRDVAILAIEFFDMIDSIDHRTSTRMGGTPEIQQYAHEGRQEARDFTGRVPDSD
jgi:hypothetical protein